MDKDGTSEQPTRKRRKSESPSLPPGGVRAAYTLEEFASIFGKHKNWGYRLVWAGKVKVIRPLGEMLVPRSEIDRLTAAPVDYETVNG